MSKILTVLVTGCASGIGNCITTKYLQEGYKVLGIDKVECSFPGDFTFYFCDLSNKNNVINTFEKIKEKIDSINYLISCAGILFDKCRNSIEMLDLDEWYAVLNNNLTSSMIITREAIPLLKKSTSDKAIVFVSSDQAFYPKNKSSAYATSKGGLVAFSKASAVELIKYGIRVNTVAPASVKTNFIKKMAGSVNRMEDIYQKENEKMPLGIIEPKEVAELLFFLGTPKSNKITGQTITIDSGLYL